MPETVNSYQKGIQKFSQANEIERFAPLNKKSSEIWLYSKIIQILSQQSPDKIKVAKTLSVLQGIEVKYSKKRDLAKDKPRKYDRYWKPAQNLVESFAGSIESDIIFLSQSISEIYTNVQKRPLNETAAHWVVAELENRLSGKSSELSTLSIELSEKVKHLLEMIEDEDSNSILSRVPDKHSVDKEKLELLVAREKLLSSLAKQLSVDLDRERSSLRLARETDRKLRSVLTERRNTVGEIREAQSHLKEELRSKDCEIKRKNQEIADKNICSQQLDDQIYTLEIQSQQDRKRIEDLEEKLSIFGDGRLPEGKYIGRINSGKYHFNRGCKEWWGLVGKYGSFDKSEGIYTSHSSRFFEENGIEPCDICGDYEQRESHQ